MYARQHWRPQIRLLPGPKRSNFSSATSAACRRRIHGSIRSWSMQRPVIEDVDGNLFDFGRYCCHRCRALSSARSCRNPGPGGEAIHMSGTDFYYEPQIDLAQRLAELAPGPSSKRVFFTNSGAEALEAGLKLSRWHTGRSHVIAFFGAFHGRTYGAMSLSGSKIVHRRGFSPLVPDIHHVPFPRNCNQCSNDSRCGCVSQIEDTILKRLASPDEVAAIFVEPIQGEGGYHVAPPNFLPGLRRLCDRHGILLVADEVQCGMGRTGKLFAMEHWNVEPDIICLAKGIASGMPLGAIIARDEVMDWPPGSHASTFGGNPVSCRAALATLELLEQGYTTNAAERGKQLQAGLRRLQAKHPELGDVRGLGLMTAVDIVQANDRQKYHPERVTGSFNCVPSGAALARLRRKRGPILPPLCITAEQVETALHILSDVLAGEKLARMAV